MEVNLKSELNAKGDLSIPQDWTTPPELEDLIENFNDAKPYHDENVGKIQECLAHLNITGSAKLKKTQGRSSVQPQLIRKHAEWRYAALSEAFLSSSDIFKIKPRTAADKLSAGQNQVLLNYQWNNLIDKTSFVDNLVRTAVDEGTIFARVGWEANSSEETKAVPIYEYYPATEPEQINQLQQAAMVKQKHPYAFKELVPEHMQQALELTEQHGQAIYPVLVEEQQVTETVYSKNQPTAEICNVKHCYPDPSCNGDLEKANFFIFSFETCKSDLRKAGNYFNIDKIKAETDSVLAAPDHQVDDYFEFKDEPRKKFVAYEYWGYWDVDGSGMTTPIVCTWVGKTLIRMEENPYPDRKIPFVSSQYLPVRDSLYGESDGVLLRDNQAIIGAVTRGAIDLLARSSNAQEGMRQDALDAVNKRKYQKGENFEFNPNVDPRQAMIQMTYPEVPNSVSLMLNWQNNDAESLTGIKPYSGGLSGKALGDTATAVRGVLDAATKRETGILRRLTKLMNQIGKRFMAMNAAFLSDKEIIRVTDEDFVAIRREDLAGNFDLEVDIATAEEDNAKAQELAFMLQTMGNTLPLDMSQIVLADIARLRKMPNLAKRIEDYEPKPDPMQQQLQQIELQMKQLELQELQQKIGKTQADTQLTMAKTQETMGRSGNLQSDTDQKNLDFLEQQSGVKHNREMQQNKAQSEGNMALEILKADLAKTMPKPKPKSL